MGMRVEYAMNKIVGLGAGGLADRLYGAGSGGDRIDTTDNDNGAIHRIKVFPARSRLKRNVGTSVLSGLDTVVNIDAMVVHHSE
jgi:hypothetical protein